MIRKERHGPPQHVGPVLVVQVELELVTQRWSVIRWDETGGDIHAQVVQPLGEGSGLGVGQRICVAAGDEVGGKSAVM